MLVCVACVVIYKRHRIRRQISKAFEVSEQAVKNCVNNCVAVDIKPVSLNYELLELVYIGFWPHNPLEYLGCTSLMIALSS